MSAAPDGQLRSQARNGFFWAYGSFFGARLAAFGSTLVLARLLVPAQFGVVAFTLAIIAYLDNIADLGLGSALVQRADGDDRRSTSTVFWTGLATACVLVAACFLFAPALARVGPGPEVAPMLRVLSLGFVIKALANTQDLLFHRHLAFRKLAVPEWIAAIVKAAVSIVLAVVGLGAWSLVWGQLAGVAARSTVLCALSSWRPSFVVSRERLRSMLRFGLGIATVGLIGEAVSNVDYIIIGAKLGSAALGLYLLAFRIPDLLITAGFRVANTVFFPFYARLRDGFGREDREHELRRGYRQTLRLGGIVALPAGAVMAALALPLVLTLYGEEWRSSAAPLAFIALWAAWAALTSLPGALFKAIGRSWLLTLTAALELTMVLPALWFAADVSITAVAIAHAAVKVAFFVLLAFFVRSVLGVSLQQTAVSLAPGIFLGVTSALAAIGPAHLFSPPVALVTGGGMAALVYTVLLLTLFPKDARSLLGRLHHLFDAVGRRRRPAPGQPASVR